MTSKYSFTDKSAAKPRRNVIIETGMSFHEYHLTRVYRFDRDAHRNAWTNFYDTFIPQQLFAEEELEEGDLVLTKKNTVAEVSANLDETNWPEDESPYDNVPPSPAIVSGKRSATEDPEGTPEPKRMKTSDDFASQKEVVKVRRSHYLWIYPDLTTEKLFDFAANTFVRRFLRSRQPNVSAMPTSGDNPRTNLPSDKSGLGQNLCQLGTELLALCAENTSTSQFTRLVLENEAQRRSGKPLKRGTATTPCECSLSALSADPWYAAESSTTPITPHLNDIRRGAFPSMSLNGIRRRISKLDKRILVSLKKR